VEIEAVRHCFASFMKTAGTSTERLAQAEPHRTFNVLVAYEDYAAANRAKKFCDHLLHQAGKGTEFCRANWKFNLLQNQKLKEMADEDAYGADMLIIATHSDGELPEEVKTWISLWLEQSGQQRPALVVMSDLRVDLREGWAASLARASEC